MMRALVWGRLRAFCFCFFILAATATAQSTPTILYVDYDNAVAYAQDVSDLSKLAKTTGIVAATPPAGFYTQIAVLDVTAVNGSPAKGVVVFSNWSLNLRPNPSPGQAMSDVTRNAPIAWFIEIMNTDGGQIGSMYGLGLSGATPPPGSPPDSLAGNNAILGGTGAYFGTRGSIHLLATSTNTLRAASQTEDPSMRRTNGGGKGRYILQILPVYMPEVVTTATGPMVLHSDWTAVASDRPARRGEVLTVLAKGLGPTAPTMNPGDPFPETPLAVVTSPVEVLVNGKPVPAVNKVGFPGTLDTYRVDFSVPDNAATGLLPIQVSAAWVKGPAVRIPVQ
jgi:uncharacterized protein (TIGR03437 family)